MDLSFIVIQSILVFVLFLLAVLLYVLPAGKKKQNLPLCLFLGIVALHILVDLTFDHPLLGSMKLHLVPSIFIFAYAPLLYLHANALLENQVNRKWLHFILLAFFAVYYAIDGFSNTIFFPIYGLQYASYAILTTRLVNKKSGIKPIVKIWVFFLVYSFGLIWFFAFAANAMSLFSMENVADVIELISYVISILFFVGLIFFAMSQPGLFMHIRVAKSNQNRPVQDVSEEEKLRIDRLKELFEKEKVYSNSDLNREILANLLGIDPQQLSKEVNQHFKMNLSELINLYRIQEAQEILKTENLHIKEVYYQVGFNSRSVFNTAFKKIVKMTPSEFKNSL